MARIFSLVCIGGWSGVNLFFVLSGFLITGILLDSKDRRDYYRRFYIRRALRILPALYLLLILLAILPRTGLFEARQVGWPFLLLSFFYLANSVDLFGVPAQYIPLWSLAVEEHFYLLWPTAIRTFSRRTVTWFAAAIFLMSPVIRAINFKLGNFANGYHTWLTADGLAIGAFLAVLSRGSLAGRSAMRTFSLGCMIGAGALFAFGTPLGIWHKSACFGTALRPTGINLFFAGLLAATLLLGSSRWSWIVRRPILQWFGEISYGLYLIHMLAFDFVNHWIARFAPEAYAQLSSRFGLMVLRFILAVALAVLLAFLSRRYFEERFLRLKDRWAATVTDLPVTSSAMEGSSQPIRQTA